MKKTHKAVTLAFAIALCGAGLRAQAPKIIGHGGGLRFEARTQEEPAGLTKIFSNLGPATSAYSADGFIVEGPAYGDPEFVGMPFTPKADYNVEQLRAAVQYCGSGANQVELSLYSDADGVPGVSLAGPVTVKNLPTFPTFSFLHLRALRRGLWDDPVACLYGPNSTAPVQQNSLRCLLLKALPEEVQEGGKNLGLLAGHTPCGSRTLAVCEFKNDPPGGSRMTPFFYLHRKALRYTAPNCRQ
jgi:hypothetical protein